MGMPAILTHNGTGTAIWTPDWMQTPFVVGISLVPTGAAGSASVDATMDDPNTIASPTWWSVIGATAGLATAICTAPVQAFRLNVGTSVATTVFTVTFVQATYGR